jgi:hypothetical protein
LDDSKPGKAAAVDGSSKGPGALGPEVGPVEGPGGARLEGPGAEPGRATLPEDAGGRLDGVGTAGDAPGAPGAPPTEPARGGPGDGLGDDGNEVGAAGAAPDAGPRRGSTGRNEPESEVCPDSGDSSGPRKAESRADSSDPNSSLASNEGEGLPPATGSPVRSSSDIRSSSDPSVALGAGSRAGVVADPIGGWEGATGG